MSVIKKITKFIKKETILTVAVALAIIVAIVSKFVFYENE